MSRSSCTEKIPGTLISKFNTFHNNIKYSIETLPIYMFDYLNILLTAII